MISDFPVIVDACVLVQAAIRDTLLRLFERRLFLARWTDEITIGSTNFGAYGNYGNVRNYGNPGSYASIGMVGGYDDVEMDWMR